MPNIEQIVVTTLVVKLFLQDKGKWLFLAQTTQNGGKYSLVGGKIESEEVATAALIRESAEEAGILLDTKNLSLAFVMFQLKDKNRRIVTLYFKADKWKGDLESKEPKKFKRVNWFAVEDLPKNISDNTKLALKSYLKGITFAETPLKAKTKKAAQKI